MKSIIKWSYINACHLCKAQAVAGEALLPLHLEDGTLYRKDPCPWCPGPQLQPLT